MLICEGCGHEAIREGMTLRHADGTDACVAEDGVARTHHIVGPADQRHCDFCNRTVEVNHFIITARLASAFLSVNDSGGTSSLTLDHSDDWGICDGCAEHAKRRDFIGIVDRYIDFAREHHGLTDRQEKEVRSAVGELHAEVWKCWDGKFHSWA